MLKNTNLFDSRFSRKESYCTFPWSYRCAASVWGLLLWKRFCCDITRRPAGPVGKSQADTVGSNRVFEFRHRRSSGWATEVKSCTDQWEGRNFRITASQLFDLFEVPGKLAAASLFWMRCWIWRTQAPWDQSSGMTWSCFISNHVSVQWPGAPLFWRTNYRYLFRYLSWGMAKFCTSTRRTILLLPLPLMAQARALYTVCSEISYSVIHLSLPPAVSLSLFSSFLPFVSLCLS